MIFHTILRLIIKSFQISGFKIYLYEGSPRAPRIVSPFRGFMVWCTCDPGLASLQPGLLYRALSGLKISRIRLVPVIEIGGE
jgi:hypothetical protein